MPEITYKCKFCGCKYVCDNFMIVSMHENECDDNPKNQKQELTIDIKGLKNHIEEFNNRGL